MPVSRPRPSVRATRRTTIAAASLVALAGCRWGPDEDEPTSSSEPDVDADSALVVEAGDAVNRQLALVLEVGEKHRGLAGVLAPLERVHDAHLDLLLGPARGAPLPSLPRPAGESAAQALADVGRGESGLQAQLLAFALEAESGQLAQALGSMSASIAQHRAVLPRLGKGPA